MAYIGVQPADAYTSFAVQHFTTSATTSYTLDNPVANENEIALFINNVRQEPGSGYAYTASGTSLTLSAATSASDTMYCVFIGKAVQTVTPANGSVTNDMLAGSIANSKLANSSITLNGSAVSLGGSATTGFESQLFHVVDEQSGDGGTFTGGTQTRVLNTIRTNEITGASLSSNQITLPTGTYYIESTSVAFLVGRHQAKLRNTSDSTNVLWGTNGHTSDGSGIGQNPSIITGRFTITASKVFEIQHNAEYTRSGNGFGISSGSNNIYTDCKIWKVA